MTEDKVNLGITFSISRHERNTGEETDLGPRASQIGTKHDSPRSLVGELFACSLEPILEKFEVTTTTVSTFLVLDFVLDNERFVAEVDSLFEWSRDSMMGSLGLCNKTLVTFNDTG